ncbi:LemA family protein, partial [bacterium]|nr:LemA family protein [bacterium]
MNWIILILLLVLVWVVVTFNRMVVLRNRTHNQWAQVESELKRRFDLISRLVTVMQGHQIYEANTLTAVVEERRLAHEG